MIKSAHSSCYYEKKYADEVKEMNRQLPKNIRQIGNVSDSTKIYVEDYVDTFFNQLCEKADQSPIGAFLVGEVVQEEEEDYIYVYGAIRMQEIQQKGRDVHIQDSTWKDACEVCKEFFGDAEILGWFLAVSGQPLEITPNFLKVHQKLFAREKSIFILKDSQEKEEKYYLHKYRDLMECAGHYIYYEKNIEMQNYMISIRKKMGMTPSEIIEDTVTKNFRSVVRDKMGKNQQQTSSRFTYVLSTFLVLVVVVIGVTMVNNYDKMQGVQDSLDKLNASVSEREDEDAIETVGTIVSGMPDIEDDSQSEENLEEKDEQDLEDEKNNGSEQISIDTTTDDSGNIQENTGEVYTVEEGDTLATISRKVYGDMTHIDAICEMNGLEDGNLIYIGQKLLLP